MQLLRLSCVVRLLNHLGDGGFVRSLMTCVGKGFEKFRGALRLRRREKRFRRILFNDMAVFEKDNAVGDGPRKFHFVRDDHH